MMCELGAWLASRAQIEADANKGTASRHFTKD